MKVMVLFGTRPEIIKLAPVIQEIQKRSGQIELVVVSTGQHREFTEQMTAFFCIRPDYELDVMRDKQSLAHIVSRVIEQLDPILDKEAPDVLIVQGDTSSSTAGAIAAGCRGIRVAHVEAGLRTQDKMAPFPEEMNRRITGVAADWHFAPSLRAMQNLVREGKDVETIFVTGNTVIDAMLDILDRDDLRPPDLPVCRDKEILVTLHRRESFGQGMKQVCYALKTLVEDHDDVGIILPVHWNPNVRRPVNEILGGIPSVQLVPPLSYIDFLQVLRRCHLVLTDSGGVQEEAPSLGKPVLVLRDVTERPEAIEAGVARLVGTDPYRILSSVGELLRSETAYSRMAKCVSPFGDGRASERIVGILLRESEGYPYKGEALSSLTMQGAVTDGFAAR